MDSALIILASVVFGVVGFSFVARWYVMPRLAALGRADALQPLLLHSFRYVGLLLMAPALTGASLAGEFAYPAAVGDFVAAGLAVIAIAALRNHWRNAVALVWLFNIFGTVDLLYALVMGTVSGAVYQLGAAAWIPILFVPPLLVSHAIIFRLLSQPQPVQG